MTEPVVSAEGVVKYYDSGEGRVAALAGCNLQLSGGSFTTIMGPSGSGKSTLLHVLAGLTTADAGRVLIGGEDLGALGDRLLTRFRRRHIGLIFQSFNLVPSLSAIDNVALPLVLDGQSRTIAKTCADALMQRLGLGDRQQHLPDQLSGGEQQRVAIARALVTEPALVLADEPTGNLDSERSLAICQLLRDLQRERGVTLLVVTHEAAVASYADEALVLRDGQVHEQFRTEGDAVALAQRYQQACGAG